MLLQQLQTCGDVGLRSELEHDGEEVGELAALELEAVAAVEALQPGQGHAAAAGLPVGPPGEVHAAAALAVEDLDVVLLEVTGRHRGRTAGEPLQAVARSAGREVLEGREHGAEPAPPGGVGVLQQERGALQDDGVIDGGRS